MKKEIIIQSFNPYEKLYPNIRIITRDTIDLIKYFRSEGFYVKILPDNNTPIYYLARKGVKEILSDPVIAIVVNASISLVTSLLGAYLFDKYKKNSKEIETKLVFEVQNDGNKIRYNHRGEQISDERFNSILKFMERKKKNIEENMKESPPDKEHIVPIFFEHGDKIIGWGKFEQTTEGKLILTEGTIADKEILKKIDDGEYNGLSLGSLVEKMICSICGRDYKECSHFSHKKYDGKNCIVELKSGHFIEVSIVKDPANPNCRLWLTQK